MLVPDPGLTDNGVPVALLDDALSLAAPADAAAALAAHLGALAPGFALEWIACCASSNTELLNRDLPADERIAVLVADEQTAGRGRRGRQWQSWPEGSLTFSLRWRFPVGSPAPSGLSLVVGLALVQGLKTLGVDGLQLKWPNDVLVHGNKLAGILIELVSGRGRSSAAVIGIGLNLRLPADAHIPDQPGVTDLARELDGPLPDRPRLLAALLVELQRLLALYAQAGFPALRPAWERYNAFAELPVQVSGDTGIMTGVCVGADEDGALLLRNEHGLHRLLSGDVSLRALAGAAR